jgi:DNA-3-methyladenine glycosylase I
MVKSAIEQRCPWCTADPLYIEYHDHEWGIPVADERALFERLVLEGMQAGLSWLTVLRKRERMQACFFEFDPQRLAQAGERDLQRWLTDAGLIRHRGKLEAMVENARRVVAMDGGFAEVLWSAVGGRPRQNRYRSLAQVPSQTDESRALAKQLKQLGFRFVGPTTCYAFMQSAGLVNDHLISCTAHARCRVLGTDWTL